MGPELPKEAVEASRKDLEYVALATNASPVLGAMLSGSATLVEDDNLSIRAFEDLYDDIHDAMPSLNKEQKEFLTAWIKKKIIVYARKNFYIYLKYMAPLMLPEDFVDGRHIKLVADELQKIEKATDSGKPQRLAISLPPGGMKSISVNLFISWCLGRHPNWRILHIGHGTQFVEDNAGRPIRDLIGTQEYQEIFPGIEIKKDSRASGRWDTNKRGQYYAAGVDSRIAGRRAHIAICDDAMSEQTAYSIVERRKINAWYGPGLRTRLLPKGSEIQIGTRWHTEDLIGFLLNKDANSTRPWREIKIPAILNEKAAKLLKMEVGESFWPEFQPLKFLKEKMTDGTLSPSQASALYMQEPIPEEGNILSEKDFKFWTKPNPPDVDLVILSIDGAYSEKTSADFSAYTVWGIFQVKKLDSKGRDMWLPNLILIEAGKGRWSYPDLMSQVQEMYDYYKPDLVIVEKESSGRAMIPELQLRGLPVIAFNPREYGDKIMRLNACTPFFRNGRIWVPESQSFTNDVVKESLEFPFGAHDDYVDTMTQAIIHMQKSMNLSVPGYMSEDEEEDRVYERKRKTYWQAASNE